jgi:hypothetical protein
MTSSRFWALDFITGWFNLDWKFQDGADAEVSGDEDLPGAARSTESGGSGRMKGASTLW